MQEEKKKFIAIEFAKLLNEYPGNGKSEKEMEEATEIFLGSGFSQSEIFPLLDLDGPDGLKSIRILMAEKGTVEMNRWLKDFEQDGKYETLEQLEERLDEIDDEMVEITETRRPSLLELKKKLKIQKDEVEKQLDSLRKKLAVCDGDMDDFEKEEIEVTEKIVSIKRANKKRARSHEIDEYFPKKQKV